MSQPSGLDYSMLKDLIDHFATSEVISMIGAIVLIALKQCVDLIVKFRTKKESSIQLLLQNYAAARGDFYLMEQTIVERYRVQIPYRGIQLFLRNDFASESYVNYRLGYKYLKFSSNYRTVKLLKSAIRTTFEQWLFGLLYVVFGFLGIMMFIYAPEAFNQEKTAFLSWLFSAVALVVIAIFCLINSFSIRAAKELAAKFA